MQTLCIQNFHPFLVSAFYFESPEKQISMNASIWTKSKFMGMSIGVVMIGKGKIHFVFTVLADLSHKEYIQCAFNFSFRTIIFCFLKGKTVTA